MRLGHGLRRAASRARAPNRLHDHPDRPPDPGPVKRGSPLSRAHVSATLLKLLIATRFGLHKLRATDFQMSRLDRTAGKSHRRFEDR